jgi:hypothetical protein
MDLLTTPFERERARAAFPVVPPLLLLAAAMFVFVAVGRWVEMSSAALGPLGRALEGAAMHAGFIAMGFVIAFEGRPGWQRPALRVTVTLVAAFALSRLGAWGSPAFALVPAILLLEARRHPMLARIGALGWPRPRALLVGLAAGGFLGAHLLVSASMTFGYAVRVDAPGRYLAALAYDVGANALSAEWLLRGAIFSHWWTHFGFWPAAAIATGFGLVRYLLDPALPHTLEVGAGAIFYLALLSLAASALRAWSGSLLPGYVAAVAFFAAYRTLAVG